MIDWFISSFFEIKKRSQKKDMAISNSGIQPSFKLAPNLPHVINKNHVISQNYYWELFSVTRFLISRAP